MQFGQRNKTVTVTATAEFDHEARHYRPGEPVTVGTREALKLRARGYVSFSRRRYTTAAIAHEPEPAPVQEPPRRSRRYRRRDMVAEGLPSDSD